MKYTFTYQVQYQEVDSDRKLRLYTLENYLLNVAGLVSDQLGYGIKQLFPYGYTWIITRLSLEMLYIPTHQETLHIETWVEQNAHCLSTRDYRIYLERNGKNELIGIAKSVWTLLDLKKREIVNGLSLPMFQGTEDGEVLSMARATRQAPITEPDLVAPHTIQYSDVDYNNHCNSCKYLEIMLDAKCPIVDNSCIRLDINYVKEVHKGKQIQTLVKEDSNSIYYQQKDENGTICCQAKIQQIEHLSC